MQSGFTISDVGTPEDFLGCSSCDSSQPYTRTHGNSGVPITLSGGHTSGGRWRGQWRAVGGGRCGPKRPEKVCHFFYFDREVTPGAPSLRKPQIKAGGLLKVAPESQWPMWGGFGVLCGQIFPGLV